MLCLGGLLLVLPEYGVVISDTCVHTRGYVGGISRDKAGHLWENTTLFYLNFYYYYMFIKN